MTKWTGIALLIAAAVAIAAADVLNPQWSPAAQPVSRYVNGTAGWLVTLAILAIGLASAVVARRVRGPGRGLLWVWAGGVLIAAVFPADPPGNYANPSISDTVHGIVALIAFAVFPIGALRTRRHRRPAATSAVLTVTFALFLVEVMDGPTFAFGGIGLVERLLIGVNLLWLGAYLLKPAVRPLSSCRLPTA